MNLLYDLTEEGLNIETQPPHSLESHDAQEGK